MRGGSQLVSKSFSPVYGPALGSVIALHDINGGMDDLARSVAAWSPTSSVIAVEAARAVFLGMEITGHTWYGGEHVERPELVSFGDSLMELERFVVERAERFEAGACLFGWGQGAVMGLSLAAVIPEQFSRVIAVGGCLPMETGWSPPDERMSGLPLLLIHTHEHAENVQRSTVALKERGADVSVAFVSELNVGDQRIIRIIQSWLRTT